MNPWDKYVVPAIINLGCGCKMIEEERERVIPRAHGRVLELGMGPGHNIAFYDTTRVSEVIGVDPSAELRPHAERRAAQSTLPVSIQTTIAEKMDVEDKSIDTLVLTFTLCTIPDPISALTACRRVLKPDADIYFCEHGKAPDISIQKWQNRINPVWRRLLGGCNVNRPIPKLLEQSGYAIADLESYYGEKGKGVAGYFYRGSAKPA